jgi:hypothetical protein
MSKKMTKEELIAHRKSNEKYYNKGISNTQNAFTRWTQKEIKIVLERKMSDAEISKKLGRTISAIEGCRGVYAKKKTFRNYILKGNSKDGFLFTEKPEVTKRPTFKFKDVWKDIIEELECLIDNNKTIHIKTIGNTLKDYGLGYDMKNIIFFENRLIKNGVTIRRG